MSVTLDLLLPNRKVHVLKLGTTIVEKGNFFVTELRAASSIDVHRSFVPGLSKPRKAMPSEAVKEEQFFSIGGRFSPGLIAVHSSQENRACSHAR